MQMSELLDIVKRAGGQLWLVGGAVRDAIMGVPVKDRDFMVTGLDINDLPFDRVAGHDFPVFIVEVDGETCELAMARTEKKHGTGYHGFKFWADRTVTVEQDLSRRDITINALAQNVETGDIIDPFNGLCDIKHGVIRHVSDAFREDATRVYRVARFAARFGFTVSDETMGLIAGMRQDILDITVERVEKELMKALETERPSVFFRVLKDAGLLDIHFSPVAALDVPDTHNGTAFEHTMRVMDAGTNVNDRFALLCHDFGKALTPADKHPQHFNHDKLGVPVVKEFCKSLRIPNKLRDFAVASCELHMQVKRVLDMKTSSLVKLVVDTRELDNVLRISRIDSCNTDASSEKDVVLHDAIDQRVSKVRRVVGQVTGKSLLEQGVKPDKNFGEKLLQARFLAVKAIL